MDLTWLILVYAALNVVTMALPKAGETPAPVKTETRQVSSSSVAVASQPEIYDPEAAVNAQIDELDREDQVRRQREDAEEQDRLRREEEDRRRAEAEAEAQRQALEAARRAKQEQYDREQFRGWQAFLKALIKGDKAAADRVARMLDRAYVTDQLLSASDLTSAIASKVGKFARIAVKFDSDAPGGVLVFPYSVDLGFRLLGEDIRPNLPQRLFLEGAPHGRFVSDEVFTVVGRVKGTYKYDTAIGGTNTVPAIRFEYLFPQSNN